MNQMMMPGYGAIRLVCADYRKRRHKSPSPDGHRRRGEDTGEIFVERHRASGTRRAGREGGNMANEDDAYGIETLAIHAGASPDPATGARSTPIYQTVSYVFDNVDHAASLYNLQTFGYLYTRVGNPTVSVLEERVAALEGGRAAVACASGHSAQLLAFFPLMEPGAEFLASRNLYGGSITQFTHTFTKFGWHAHLVDPRDPENFRRALTPKCKAIFVEQLTNPAGIVVDIAAIAAIAHEAEIPLIVDNTIATPYLCRPFAWGADIVTHAMTKFLGGHGNSMGGIVVESGKFDWSQNDKFPGLTKPDPAYHGLTFYETFGDFGFTMKTRAVGLRDLGPALSPLNAFLILTGTETLPLRMERHVANARKVAEFLEDHSAVSWVAYAGLKSSPYYALAQKYLPRGAGSVFTFGVKGGYEAGIKAVESCELWSHLANVGDTRSLILHPASTTHRQLTDEQRDAAGAGQDVIRLSVGLETADDIIRDLDQALAAARRSDRVGLATAARASKKKLAARPASPG
jgi:O-acetylhomoserine (thiol)-lyase